jgi:hypothetical protein
MRASARRTGERIYRGGRGGMPFGGDNAVAFTQPRDKFQHPKIRKCNMHLETHTLDGIRKIV